MRSALPGLLRSGGLFFLASFEAGCSGRERNGSRCGCRGRFIGIEAVYARSVVTQLTCAFDENRPSRRLIADGFWPRAVRCRPTCAYDLQLCRACSAADASSFVLTDRLIVCTCISRDNLPLFVDMRVRFTKLQMGRACSAADAPSFVLTDQLIVCACISRDKLPGFVSLFYVTVGFCDRPADSLCALISVVCRGARGVCLASRIVHTYIPLLEITFGDLRCPGVTTVLLGNYY